MKRMLLFLLTTVLILTTLSVQPASAAKWNKTGGQIIHEPVPNIAAFAASDPDELPFIPTPSKPKKLQGDADGNGEVNYMDALLVLRHSVGLEELSKDTVELCDVDRTGNLSYMDALMILRYSVGLITEF